MRKFVFTLFISIFLGGTTFAQQYCSYPGLDSLWDARFKHPGIKNGINDAYPGTDGYLYLAGSTNTAPGGEDTYTMGVSRFDGEKYEPLGNGYYPTLSFAYCVTADDSGNIYFGGTFDGGKNADGTQIASHGIIKWNIYTESWEPVGLGIGGSSASVKAIKWHNDTLYVGGRFTEAYTTTDTIATKNIALYSTVTNQWDSLGGGLKNVTTTSSSWVYTIETDLDGNVLAGGFFDRADTVAVWGVARWNPATGWDDFDGGLPVVQWGGAFSLSTVWDLVTDTTTGRVYAAGYFYHAYTNYKNFATWDTTGSWTVSNTIGGSTGDINCLYIDYDSNIVFFGGEMSQGSGQGNGIAGFRLSDSTYLSLKNGVTKVGYPPTHGVDNITKFQGKIYVLGDFNRVDGGYGLNFAGWDGNAWDNVGNGPNQKITSITEHGGSIYVAGVYRWLDYKYASEDLGVWNDATGWKTIDIGLWGYYKRPLFVEAIGDSIWFAGMFDGIADTIPAYNIGVYDLTTNTVKSVGSGTANGNNNELVYAIAEFQGEVYVGGVFTMMDGNSSLSKLAKYNPATGTWSAVPGFTGASGITAVKTLKNVGDSVLYIGGSFNNVGGNADLKSIAAWNGTSISPVGKGVGGDVQAIEMDANGILHVGGNFSWYKQWDGTQVNGSFRIIQYYDSLYVDSIGLQTSGTAVVNAITSDSNGMVYFGGQFVTPQGYYIHLKHIGRWSPQHGLSGFGKGIASTMSTGYPVDGLHFYNGDLFVHGAFYRTGDAQAYSFARYTLEDSIPVFPIISFADTLAGCDSLVINANHPDDQVVWSTGDTANEITVYASGTYWVHASSSYGCESADTFYVQINGSPDLAAEPDTVNGCGDSLLLAGPAGYETYVWSTGDNSQIIVVNTGYTAATVTVSDSNSCTASHTYHTWVYSNPVFDLGPDTTGCGDALIIAPVSGVDYSWNTGDTTQSISVTNSGTYSVTITDGNNCSAEDSVAVTIHTFPVVNLPDSTEGCFSATVSAPSGYDGYNWNTGDTTATIVATFSSYYMVTVTSNMDCKTLDTVFVSVYHPDTNIFQQDTLVGCDEVSVSIPGYFDSFVWNDGDNTSLTKSTTDTAHFSVTVTDSNGCSYSDSIGLLVGGYTPSAVITSTFVGIYDTVQFDADPMQGANLYYWAFGDGNSANGQSVTHIYGQQGTYTAMLVVGSDCGVDTSYTDIEIVSTGIANQGNRRQITMYPNPANSELTIVTGNIVPEWIEIYDLTGRLVLSEVYNTSKIDISKLPPATYFLIVYPEEGLPSRIPFIKL